MSKIPARYIGGHQLLLAGFQGPHYDGDGNRLSSLVVSPGDTLMMEEHEIRGQTYKFDPRGNDDPLFLGYGSHIVLPEHEDLSDEVLQAIGYQFHQGRPDFEEYTPQTQPAGQETPVANQPIQEASPPQPPPDLPAHEALGASTDQVASEEVQ